MIGTLTIPLLLVIAGVICVVLAIIGRISGKIEIIVPPERQRILGGVGAVFLVIGLVLGVAIQSIQIYESVTPTPTPPITPTQAPSPTPTLTPTPTPTPTLTQTPSVIPSPLHSPIPTEAPIPAPTPTVTITDPNAGDYVPWRYTVKGTSNMEPNSDLNIYVFIYAWGWYAQPKAIISSNGNWETRDRCRFGNPEHGGLDYTYDICAIVTTKDFEVDEQFANLPDYKAKSEIIKVIRE